MMVSAGLSEKRSLYGFTFGFLVGTASWGELHCPRAVLNLFLVAEAAHISSANWGAASDAEGVHNENMTSCTPPLKTMARHPAGRSLFSGISKVCCQGVFGCARCAFPVGIGYVVVYGGL